LIADQREPGCHPHEFGDDVQKVCQRQRRHAAVAPEPPEMTEQQFPIFVLSDRRQAHRHFLEIIADRGKQEEQRQKQAYAECSPSHGIADHAAGVVVGKH